jgi:hypothetical protein
MPFEGGRSVSPVCGQVGRTENQAMVRTGLALLALEAADEIQEAVGLFFEAADEGGVFDFSVGAEGLADAGEVDAVREDGGLSVLEDGFELFDGPEGAPHAGGDADEAGGYADEAFGKFQHIDEVLGDAGHAAIVFRRDPDDALALEDGLAEAVERRRFFGVGGGREDFRRQLGEVEDVEVGGAGGLVDGGGMVGDLGAEAARAVGSDHEGKHGGKGAPF